MLNVERQLAALDAALKRTVPSLRGRTAGEQEEARAKQKANQNASWYESEDARDSKGHEGKAKRDAHASAASGSAAREAARQKQIAREKEQAKEQAERRAAAKQTLSLPKDPQQANAFWASLAFAGAARMPDHAHAALACAASLLLTRWSPAWLGLGFELGLRPLLLNRWSLAWFTAHTHIAWFTFDSIRLTFQGISCEM